MSPLGLALAYLKDRSIAAALNVLLLALGVATIVAALLFTTQTQGRLTRDAAGIDLVVGAKGSPLQLILSSIFHADAPIGNVPSALVDEIAAERFVRTVIPLALGDSVGGFRLVGATPAYMDLYDAQLAAGRVYEAPLEAVAGADAAAAGLTVGVRFESTHGMSEGGGAHDHVGFHVVGVLAPTGTVLDRLVLTPVESVWLAHGIHVHVPHEDEASSAPSGDETHADHDHADDGHADEDHGPVEGQDVTAILVQYASPLAAASVPRRINESTQAMAAVPAVETTRLLSLVGSGVDVVRGFAGLFVGAATLSVFVTMWTAMRERRRDIALMRAMGAGRGRVVSQLLIEGVLVALAGALLGVLLGHVLVQALAWMSPQAARLGVTGLAFDPREAWIVLGATLLGAVGALLPALSAYRVDIVKTLES